MFMTLCKNVNNNNITVLTFYVLFNCMILFLPHWTIVQFELYVGKKVLNVRILPEIIYYAVELFFTEGLNVFLTWVLPEIIFPIQGSRFQVPGRGLFSFVHNSILSSILSVNSGTFTNARNCAVFVKSILFGLSRSSSLA